MKLLKLKSDDEINMLLEALKEKAESDDNNEFYALYRLICDRLDIREDTGYGI